MEEMIRRFVGTCQICEGEFKMDARHTMVHHGFKRPGHGYIVGDCTAVGQPAYEQSCEFLKSYTESLKHLLETWKEYLRKLQAGEVTELHAPSRETRYSRNPKIIAYKVGDKGWDELLSARTHEQVGDIRRLEIDIKRCEKRIADWKPLPVRTVDEVLETERATKAQAQAARDAKRHHRLHARGGAQDAPT